MAKDDVLTPEVIEELPLEKTIEKELVKHNVTEALIAGLKEKYGNLRLDNIEDKETYLIIKDAKKDVRKYGILTEKICKKGREDAIAIQKKWLAKEKEILGKIDEVESPLQKEIDRFDAEVERKENERIRIYEERFMGRQAELAKLGAVYANGCFNSAEIVYESNLIKEADDDMWSNLILPKYKTVFDRVEAVRVAEETKRREAQEKLVQEQAQLEKQQRELREAQETLQRQKDEVERAKRLAEQQAEEERNKAMREKIQGRANQLAALGMTFNFKFDAYMFEDVNVDNKTELCLLNDEEWNELVQKITPVIEQRKIDAEQKKQAQIAEEKKLAEEAAAKREREKIEQEQREAAIKKQQEEQERQRQLDAASDKEKWAAWIEVVGRLLPPTTMKSSSFKKKSQMAKEKLDEIINL